MSPPPRLNRTGLTESRLVADFMRRVYESGLTTVSGGNISLRDSHGNIWITPSRVDKGRLSEKDVSCVRPDGSAVAGRHPPSSELPFHQAVYRSRPDFGAIVHGHPPALVAFSIIRKVPDTRVTAWSFLICGEIGYAPYRLPGSKMLGDQIARAFREGYQAIILENHGVVVGGQNLEEAFLRFEALEACAQSIVRAALLDPAKPLTDSEISKYAGYRPVWPEYHEADREEGQVRELICRTTARACRRHMMTAASGTLSARVNDAFIITPAGADRSHLQTWDLVRMLGGRVEKGKHPSRWARLHSEIYERLSGTGCILSASPPNSMAFALSGRSMDTRTIPESYLFLRDVPLLPFESLFEAGPILEVLEGGSPVLMIQNDSLLVTAESVAEAFERLEIAEFTAHSLLDSTHLGTMKPMGDAEIEELRRTFIPE